jgi:starch synthase
VAGKGLKALFVAAEVAPFAKVGGLADVAEALPKELRRAGCDARVVMPAYKMALRHFEKLHANVLRRQFPVEVRPGAVRQCFVCEGLSESGVPHYLVGTERFFEAEESEQIYREPVDAYILFCRAVLQLPLLAEGFEPDIIHTNDWHTGLIPVFMRVGPDARHFESCASLHTIHNLAYQGEFGAEVLFRAGLPEWLNHFEYLEAYGRINLLKGGLVFSDLVNTVSETYAKEIAQPELGCRLDGLLRHLESQGRLRGILNGIDPEIFDPKTDTSIPMRYSADNLEGKKLCKSRLQELCNWPPDTNIPVLGVVSRLSEQKGLDLLADVIEEADDLQVQFVVLGTGDLGLEDRLTRISEQQPNKLAFFCGYNSHLAQTVYAGSDIFCMPSRFEPCGLGQMIAMRYGTVPLVRGTGGLADTVTDFNPETGEGWGFVFHKAEPLSLYKAMVRAINQYNTGDLWLHLVKRCMARDLSFAKSAGKYLEAYEAAIAKRKASLAASRTAEN